MQSKNRLLKTCVSKPFYYFSVSVIGGILFYGIASFCDRQTDRFSVARIHSDLSFNPKWETTHLSLEKQQELLQLLDQKFYYLGCGGQCFAFASEDGRYVIKFFKHKIRKPFSLFLKMSLPEFLEKRRLKKLNKALFKLERDFSSYKIAYEDLPEETGLIFIHLNKGTDLHKTVRIVDKIGIEHSISLDDVEFVLQKRAKLAYEYMDELMAKGDALGAKAAIHSILQVIVSRCKKGVFDEDAKIHRNFGFLDSKPIFIDVGRFRRDPERIKPAVYKNDLEAITGRFRDWLEEAYPALVPTLEEELDDFKKQD